MGAKRLITRECVDAHMLGFEMMLTELQPFSDERADSIRRSIESTLQTIREKLVVADTPQADLRGILAGLKQGFRDVPKVLYWLPPDALRRISDTADRLKAVED